MMLILSQRMRFNPWAKDPWDFSHVMLKNEIMKATKTFTSFKDLFAAMPRTGG